MNTELFARASGCPLSEEARIAWDIVWRRWCVMGLGHNFAIVGVMFDIQSAICMIEKQGFINNPQVQGVTFSGPGKRLRQEDYDAANVHIVYERSKWSPPFASPTQTVIWFAPPEAVKDSSVYNAWFRDNPERVFCVPWSPTIQAPFVTLLTPAEQQHLFLLPRRGERAESEPHAFLRFLLSLPFSARVETLGNQLMTIVRQVTAPQLARSASFEACMRRNERGFWWLLTHMKYTPKHPIQCDTILKSTIAASGWLYMMNRLWPDFETNLDPYVMTSLIDRAIAGARRCRRVTGWWLCASARPPLRLYRDLRVAIGKRILATQYDDEWIPSSLV